MIEERVRAGERVVKAARRGRAPLSLAAVAVCALAIIGAFAFVGHTSTSSAMGATRAATERVTIAVEGMHCGGCASGIRAMLKRTPSVVSAEVSYEREEAVVEYDPSRTTREKIVGAINDMGYKASVKG